MRHPRSECFYLIRSLVNLSIRRLAIAESLPNFNFYIQNALMQQHLAHLYFIAVLEQLQTKAPKPNFLIRLASKIDEVGIIENSSYLQLHFEQDVMYSTAMQWHNSRRCKSIAVHWKAGSCSSFYPTAGRGLFWSEESKKDSGCELHNLMVTPCCEMTTTLCFICYGFTPIIVIFNSSCHWSECSLGWWKHRWKQLWCQWSWTYVCTTPTKAAQKHQ